MNRTPLHLLVFLLAIAVTLFAIKSQFSAASTGFLIFILVFVPVLIKPDIGLIIIIASMLFSPELIVGFTTARMVTIRAEDVLLIVVIVAWLLKTSFTKDIVSTFRTPLTTPFFLYILLCLVSTFFAMLGGNVDIKQSFFSILKYVEYFLLFIMVRDSLKSIKQSKLYVVVFLLTAIAVAAYANVYIEKELGSGSQFFRVAPPVETREGGEAGTLGGYFIFMMAMVAGLLLHLKGTAARIFCICLLMIMFRAFLYTLSRGSYVALVPMVVGLIYFTKKNRLILICCVLVTIVTVAIFAPQMVKERVATTITAQSGLHGKQLVLEASPAERLESWKVVLFERLPRSPIFGHGVARAFIDGQIFLTLYEVGLAGFLLLACMLLRLFNMGRGVLSLEPVQNDDFSVGLTVGFLAGFMGLIGHALSTNTFIIIKIMEPFWFMAAIVLSLPRLLEERDAVMSHTSGALHA